ncbi:hypothetical protein [Dictyobacter formicarum]|uniref:Uncharacterized protein n=1 Tax=Dictyobacter formicarum TaxID=2778368 RepID=A0ABQ3VTW1_9CHLR|nr:hypothetical protein [Dictyobacter formicarum]GHO89263.1 hypothetical protein KSZ_72690 [Dictyobacter formicarum]
MGNTWLWLVVVFVIIFVPPFLGTKYSQRKDKWRPKRTLEVDVQPRSSRPAYRMPTIHAERSPLLYQQISQVRENRQSIVAAFRPVQTTLVRTLAQQPASLLYVLEQRAIMLYQEQEGTSWQEAAAAIRDFAAMYGDPSAVARNSSVTYADPMVMYLLLQAHCRRDAEAYFCSSTGAEAEVAQTVIQQIEQMIESSDATALEQGKRDPDLQAINFLLRAGYILLAIRYYRDCTEVSLQEAREAIQGYQARLS